MAFANLTDSKGGTSLLATQTKTKTISPYYASINLQLTAVELVCIWMEEKLRARFREMFLNFNFPRRLNFKSFPLLACIRSFITSGSHWDYITFGFYYIWMQTFRCSTPTCYCPTFNLDNLKLSFQRTSWA